MAYKRGQEVLYKGKVHKIETVIRIWHHGSYSVFYELTGGISAAHSDLQLVPRFHPSTLSFQELIDEMKKAPN